MKRSYVTLLLILFVLPVLTAGLMLIPKNHIAQQAGEGNDEDIAVLGKWMLQRFADPATGKIPANAQLAAYNQLIQDGRIQFSGQYKSKATRSVTGWQNINDFFPSLSVTSICYDPHNKKTFYFSTGESFDGATSVIGAGIFKSTDGGNTWAQLPFTANGNFNNCIKMLAHPITGDLYVATFHGVWRSQDGGTTWHLVTGSLSDQFSDIAVSAGGTVYAAKGVFQPGMVFRSTTGDSGTWTQLAGGFPSSNNIYFVTLATSHSKDSVIYAATCSSTNNYRVGGLYRSDNMGNTWHTISIPGTVDTFARLQAWYDLVLAVDPNHDSTVYAGGLDTWLSRDAGSTWLRLSSGDFFQFVTPYVHVDQHCAIFDGSGRLTIGCDGGVYRSTNFNDSFPTLSSKNYGYRVTQFYDIAPDPRAGNPYLVGGTQDNGTPAILNPGLSNYRSESWGDGGFAAINYNNPNIRYTTSDMNIQFRLNYAVKGIDTITNPYITNANVEFINPMVMDPNNPDILYMASDVGLWRLDSASTATKKKWTKCTRTYGGFITAIGISKSVPNLVYIGTATGGVYKVVNADSTNSTYTPVNIDPSKTMPAGTLSSGAGIYCSQIWVDPTNADHVFVIFSNYGIKRIWQSTNATSKTPTWTNEDGNMPNIPVLGILPHPTQPGVCYIATGLGVFYTTQLNGSSTNWLIGNSGLANVYTMEIKYRPSDNTMYAVTYGRGIYESAVNVSSTGSYAPVWQERGPINIGGRTLGLMIDPNDTTHQTMWACSASGGLWKIYNIDSLNDKALLTNNVPIAVVDAGVYPNPFTSSFSVQVSSDTKSHLQIFDGAGHRIIDDIFYKQYTLPSSISLAAGMYYVVIDNGSQRIVKKVVCVK